MAGISKSEIARVPNPYSARRIVAEPIFLKKYTRITQTRRNLTISELNQVCTD